MIDTIKSDLFRYSGNTSKKSFLICLIKVPGFRFMYFWRKAGSKETIKPLVFFYKFLCLHFRYKYGFQIPLTAKIGGGLYIGHFGTIIINSQASIGKNCNIGPNVVIGQTNKGRKKGVPQIGDEVWIGTGAVIVGKITIGNNVLIAPNSYVNFDIPSNSLVLGNPATIIPKDKSITEGYINNIYSSQIMDVQ